MLPSVLKVEAIFHPETFVLSAGPLVVTTQKTNIDIFASVRTRNLIKSTEVLILNKTFSSTYN
jgi:hypothetical protein